MTLEPIFPKCDGPTNRPTDRLTNIAASSVAFTRLKIALICLYIYDKGQLAQLKIKMLQIFGFF